MATKSPHIHFPPSCMSRKSLLTYALEAENVDDLHLKSAYTIRICIIRTSAFKVKNTADFELNVLQFGWCQYQYCTRADYGCDNQDYSAGTRLPHKLNKLSPHSARYLHNTLITHHNQACKTWRKGTLGHYSSSYFMFF